MADPGRAGRLKNRLYGPLPERRPSGLRRRSIGPGAVFWRLDRQPPGEWDWAGFAVARNRFDPRSGAFRVRYAAQTPAGAVRERYLTTGRYIPRDHREHQLVRMTLGRTMQVLDLRTESNLDALGVDDRISTGREGIVWSAAQELAEAARRWWPDLDGLVYRSRTTPETSFNLAFFGQAGFLLDARPLGRADGLLAELVLDHGFSVGWDL